MAEVNPQHRGSSPTVDDLRSKTCFICREEDSVERPEIPRRRWVHACKCTLVAHEVCLLEWIVSSQQNPGRSANALNCPQCATRYTLESVTPRSLKLLNALNALGNSIGRFVTALSITGTVVTIGTGVYIISTAYGAYSLREFIGKEAFRASLGDDPQSWPTTAYVTLPFIPLSLILARTPLSSPFPLLPLSLAFLTFPIRHSLRLASGRIVLDPTMTRQALLRPEGRLFPPSPYLAAAVIFPLVRYAYRWLFIYVARKVITHAGLTESRRQLNAGAAEVDIVIQIGRDEPAPQQHAAPAQQAPGAAAVNAAAAREDAAGRRWRLTDRSFGRLVGGALLIPRISSLMGKLLLGLSKHSGILRYILGVQLGVGVGSSKGLGAAVAGTLGITGKGLWHKTQLWTDHDPVWWRNAIGFGLFVVAKDCVTLWHLWLAKQELDSRHLKSFPFTDVDEHELDLIERPT